jgi:anti-sigma factor RsiW
MTCSPFDLKEYLFGELNADQRGSVDRHLLTCAACQDELAALSATRSAILCMHEEEPPRRIAFVSDKVFEPRWWQKIFASGPQLGFASAAMVAAAIVFHDVHTPAVLPAPAPVTAIAQVDRKAIEAELEKRVQAAVEKAAVEIEGRQAHKILEVVNARLAQSDRRYEMDLKTVAEYLDRVDKRNANVRLAAYDVGARP